MRLRTHLIAPLTLAALLAFCDTAISATHSCAVTPVTALCQQANSHSQ